MTHYTRTTEFEDSHIRVVQLGGVQLGPRFPANHSGRSRFREIPRREIREIIIHQSAGNSRSGVEAVERLASFFTSPPRYAWANGEVVTYETRGGKRKRKRIGGGRGWPGIAYTFVIPTLPATTDGLFDVYRIWPDEWRTWHTGGVHNTYGVGICMVGSFASRHAPAFSQRAMLRPDPTAMAALDHLVEYLADRYSLTLDRETLIPHSEAGKPACPGDFLEEWIRSKRGDDQAIQVDTDATRPWDGPLASWRDRQTALVALGFDVGPAGVDGFWGHDTRSAVEAFQASAGIVVDGVWGPVTERHIRAHMGLLEG